MYSGLQQAEHKWWQMGGLDGDDAFSGAAKWRSQRRSIIALGVERGVRDDDAVAAPASLSELLRHGLLRPWLQGAREDVRGARAEQERGLLRDLDRKLAAAGVVDDARSESATDPDCGSLGCHSATATRPRLPLYCCTPQVAPATRERCRGCGLTH